MPEKEPLLITHDDTAMSEPDKEAERGFTLSPEDERELLLAIAEADRGETLSAEEVLARVARRRG